MRLNMNVQNVEGPGLALAGMFWGFGVATGSVMSIGLMLMVAKYLKYLFGA